MSGSGIDMHSTDFTYLRVRKISHKQEQKNNRAEAPLVCRINSSHQYLASMTWTWGSGHPRPLCCDEPVLCHDERFNPAVQQHLPYRRSTPTRSCKAPSGVVAVVQRKF